MALQWHQNFYLAQSYIEGKRSSTDSENHVNFIIWSMPLFTSSIWMERAFEWHFFSCFNTWKKISELNIFPLKLPIFKKKINKTKVGKKRGFPIKKLIFVSLIRNGQSKWKRKIGHNWFEQLWQTNITRLFMSLILGGNFRRREQIFNEKRKKNVGNCFKDECYHNMHHDIQKKFNFQLNFSVEHSLTICFTWRFFPSAVFFSHSPVFHFPHFQC